ncbi:MAG: peptidase M13 [Thermoanaerobaculia bacterium]|nr:peptidase M13 [Thermoanaerobaculia bacterium]
MKKHQHSLLLLTVTLALTLTACGQKAPDESEATTPAPTPKHSGLLLDNMDLAVDPGDDFHAFVNGEWIANTEIPADKASYGIGAILHEESQEQVKAIIEDSAAGDFAAGSDEQKVGDLYASFMNTEARDALGVEPLAGELAKIDAIESYEQLAVYFAEANRAGIGMPFALGQYVDFKDPNRYMMHTWQGGLGLPDREFYFLEDAKSKEIRAEYLKHVEKMFDLAGWDNGAAAAKTIMALETRMAAEHMKKEDTRDMVALYNKFPTAELSTLMPQFAWTQYLDTAGISDIDGVVVTQVDHMKALDGIIASTPLPTWQTWLRWSALNTYAGLLTSALDQQNFAFYGTTLTGTEEQLPMWRRGVNIVNGSLGEVVGKVYVAQHFPPEAKEKMLTLVNNLTRAYHQSIEELDWMSEETRAQALDKLSKFTPKIGYPDEWRDYSNLTIESDDLLGNVQRTAMVDYERNLARQNEPVDRGEWNMTPQTVNAYYNPPLNEIVFPAAILQPPFFDLNADDAVNYGAIGAVIGHEIGHGFDDSGATFDGDGVLRNWWTDEDLAEFKARTTKLVGQYSEFQPFEDLKVNGEYTLGENIGDLGGLSIALIAYQLSLDGAEPPTMDGYTGVQRVFLGYGQAWRKKSRDEALRNQINTDPHSPAKYRVNGVVRNVPAFYEAFQIAEDDALYLAPEDRVKIW